MEWLKESWPIAALALAGLAASEVLRLRFSQWRQRWRQARRHRVAKRSEREAERVLRGQGFVVVSRQMAQRYTFQVDGEPFEVKVRPDLLVKNEDGQLFVAEVKSGKVAPRLSTASTRRQLLEYWAAFDGQADGLLLVDMTAKTVHQIAFPVQRQRRSVSHTPLMWLACGAAVGAGACGVLLSY